MWALQNLAIWRSGRRRPVLAADADEPEDWIVAGEALERVLLVATSHDVSASFLYQIIERDDMAEQESRWPWPEHCQMVLRLGYGALPLPVPRRALDAVMWITPGSDVVRLSIALTCGLSDRRTAAR